jgi:hypothetical protein
MPRRDATLIDKTALLEKIKNQPPNTSHHQLVQINGVPKSKLHALLGIKRNCEMNGHQAISNRELSKNESMIVRIQRLNKSSIMGSLS